MRTGRFITVQGIDGTGKTDTVSALVRVLTERGIPAVNYDAYKLLDAANPYEPIKKWVEASATLPAQLDFYVASMLYHSNVIRRMVAKGQTVARSRYIEDVCAHYTYLNIPNVHERICSARLLQPDVRVVLTLPEEIRRERIMRRGGEDAKDRETKTPGSRLDFFERYLLYTAQGLLNTGKAIILDTSVFTVRETAEQILECLERKERVA